MDWSQRITDHPTMANKRVIELNWDECSAWAERIGDGLMEARTAWAGGTLAQIKRELRDIILTLGA